MDVHVLDRPVPASPLNLTMNLHSWIAEAVLPIGHSSAKAFL